MKKNKLLIAVIFFIVFIMIILGISFSNSLKENHQKNLDFINLRKDMNECKLCHNEFNRTGSTQKYCKDCSILLRRLRNRQQYEFNNCGFMMDLEFLLKPTDKKIDLIELSTL